MDDRRGMVAVVFGLSALVLLMAASGAFDLQRAYTARQELSAVASLTCQYSNRPTVVSLAKGSGGPSAYVSAVNTFYGVALGDQHFGWTQTTANPFSYTSGGAGSVTLSANVHTTVMSIIGIRTIPVGVTMQCFSSLTAVPQPVPDASTTMIVSESFENSTYPSTLGWYLPSGASYPYTIGVNAFPATNNAPSTAGYVGLSGTEWIIMGYCLEVDSVGQTQTTAPDGTHSAELDCDNGSGSAGNSSISTKMWLQTGNYELRYFYDARTPNTYYGTSYICGTTAADTSWASDSTHYSGGLGARTNQLNVYLDQNTTGSPPTHLTLDGTQYLGGTNQIDQCVYSSQWIERSVLVNVTTAGYYWLSFAADGASDSFGADIDYIRFCQGTCPGTRGDDFPTAWLPSGVNNQVLFEDTFESPVQPSPATAKYFDGNLNNNIGASSFWSETGKGWANAPINHAFFFSTLCPQGNLCVTLGLNVNSAQDYWMAKPFLLDPGYYQISYDYVSEVTFSGLSGYANGYFCGATPAAAHISTLASGSGDGINRVTGTDQGSMAWQSTAVGVFMAHQMMASEPVPNSSLNATTGYISPSGAAETSPSVPPNNISLSNFTQSTVSPLLDICGYSPTAQTRTVTVLIQKPALYWLVFSLFSPYSGFGATLDDIEITALGSPWMTGAPKNPVVIPVPTPQPSSTLSFTGFSITADKY